MVFAYTIPVIFISLIITGNAIPQFGLIGNYIKDGAEGGQPLIQKINQISTDLGFKEYTSSSSNILDMFCITAALMIGTAGLPHVIVFFLRSKMSVQYEISLLDTFIYRRNLSDRTSPRYFRQNEFCRGNQSEKIPASTRMVQELGSTGNDRLGR